ncbi:MAG: MATE family efflux transporter, partial [Pseudomonadota bacterium]
MGAAGPQTATLKSAFQIAWPASLAAIVTPLLGLIDAGVMARAAPQDTLAGASLAAAVFSLLYWTFGFLRISLSGLTAQAHGAQDEFRLRSHLVQGAALGAGVGLLLTVLGGPITALAQLVLVETTAASSGAGDAMTTYIKVRLLAAPFVLATYAALGWFTGQGRTGLLMLVTTSMAAINAGLSILLVLHFDFGITGLATATAIAEVSGALIAGAGVAYVLSRRGGLITGWSIKALLSDAG